MTVETTAETDVGRARDHNEDSVLVAPTSAGRLVAVADGMGGHSAGGVASATALEAFVGELDDALAVESPTEALQTAVTAANDAVIDRAREDADREGMGTTLVAALVADGTATVVNVGDSRAYRVDDAEIEQVTVDHSVVQELVDAGEISEERADTHPQRNVLSQALGANETVGPDCFTADLAADDATLLLCSDGLTAEVPDSEIHEITTAADSLSDAADGLIASAKDHGGSDNVSVVLARHR
ncbi:MAG: Stp1/IreP family PP2C-type Ser/Thr phosphatase [Haloarculaceae archaeon]